MRVPRNSLTVSLLAASLYVALSMAACSAPVDLAKDLKVTDVVTGWYDAGILGDGKNKLVPSISFRLTNVGSTKVESVYVLLSFRRISEEEEWGSAYVKAIGPEGLAAGASTAPIVQRSGLGYTGEQPRNQMLQNREFVDARVQLFGKHGSANPVKLGEFKVERQLLTR
jgi:hypothetical protein